MMRSIKTHRKKLFKNTFGDVEAYITTQIEAAVNQNKTTIEK